MLNGAVCVTDKSLYLDKIIRDGENALYFNLKDIDSIPDRLDALLSDEQLAEKIALCGYDTAIAGHTWADRAFCLHEYMQQNF
jgi:spore maturation protein CgeB